VEVRLESFDVKTRRWFVSFEIRDEGWENSDLEEEQDGSTVIVYARCE
jgi:hypothetical protein